MRVLVTGGTSLLGRAVVGLLLARGDAVTVLQRRPSGLPCAEVLGDVADGPLVTGAAAGQERTRPREDDDAGRRDDPAATRATPRSGYPPFDQRPDDGGDGQRRGHGRQRERRLERRVRRLAPEGRILLWAGENNPDLPPDLIPCGGVKLAGSERRRILALRRHPGD